MPEIYVMSDALASQVAAGEVVERPASVVKELVENSIDAGAKSIEILLARGGISLIRVIDDGSGMAREDALLCIERHATSKLRSKEDLETIATMGFRGEALPSIASVSKFRLSTRRRDDLAGTEIRIDGGKLLEVVDSGDAPGTMVEVRSLFHNLPGRRKFLRAESTEFYHVEHQVRIHALAHSTIGFTLRHGERVVFQLPPGQSTAERLAGLIGRDVFGRLTQIPRQEGDFVTMDGWASPAGMGRNTRSLQYFFINRRPVEALTIQTAVRETYRGLLPAGQYPLAFLFLEIAPREVDVNVHPAKREVRFRHQGEVKAAIQLGLQTALERSVREIAGSESHRTPGFVKIRDHEVSLPMSITGQETLETQQKSALLDAEKRGESDEQSGQTKDSAPTVAFAIPMDLLPDLNAAAANAPISPERSRVGFRVIGQIEHGLILLGSEEGLVLMHQQAAHERVLFEQLRRQLHHESGVPTQQLLFPITLELGFVDFETVRRHLPVLHRLGVGAEVFGDQTLKIDALPAIYEGSNPGEFLNELVREIERGDTQKSRILGEDALAAAICRRAVKAHLHLHPEEVDALVARLLACEMPYTDPTGRPTLIQFSYQELARRFGRDQ